MRCCSHSDSTEVTTDAVHALGVRDDDVDLVLRTSADKTFHSDHL